MRSFSLFQRRSMVPHATTPIRTGAYNPGRYARKLTVTVTGVSGTPELWELTTGQHRRLPARQVGDAVTVMVPFDDAPAAILVWNAAAGEARMVSFASEERALSPTGLFRPTAHGRFSSSRPWTTAGVTSPGHR